MKNQDFTQNHHMELRRFFLITQPQFIENLIIFLRAMGYFLIMKVRVGEKHLLQEKLQDFSQKKN